MNLQIQTDRLIRLIKGKSQDAMRARQVAQRLQSLLPVRFREIKASHTSPRVRGALAERMALADDRYESSIEEYVNIKFQAHEARIDSETHYMLLNARKTLRRLASQRG